MTDQQFTNQEMPEGAPQCGTYRHYKGASYQVLGMARHSETDEWMVVYQALYGDYGFWLRPLSLWLEPVADADGADRHEGHEAQNTQANPKLSTADLQAPIQRRIRFELVTPSSQSLTQLTKQTPQSVT